MNLIDTMRRETQLKRWPRAKKEALIASDLKLQCRVLGFSGKRIPVKTSEVAEE